MKKDWDVEKIVHKWEPIMKSLKVKGDRARKMSEYAESHTLIAAMEPLSFPVTDMKIPAAADNALLPLSLEILKRVNDFSKVHFIAQPVFLINRNGKEEPETADSFVFQSEITQDEIMQVTGTGTDTVAMVENELIEKAAKKFNELIDEGHELYIFLVAQSIKLITTGTEEPRIMMQCRVHVEELSVTVDDL